MLGAVTVTGGLAFATGAGATGAFGGVATGAGAGSFTVPMFTEGGAFGTIVAGAEIVGSGAILGICIGTTGVLGGAGAGTTMRTAGGGGGGGGGAASAALPAATVMARAEQDDNGEWPPRMPSTPVKNSAIFDQQNSTYTDIAQKDDPGRFMVLRTTKRRDGRFEPTGSAENVLSRFL